MNREQHSRIRIPVALGTSVDGDETGERGDLQRSAVVGLAKSHRPTLLGPAPDNGAPAIGSPSSFFTTTDRVVRPASAASHAAVFPLTTSVSIASPRSLATSYQPAAKSTIAARPAALGPPASNNEPAGYRTDAEADAWCGLAIMGNRYVERTGSWTPFAVEPKGCERLSRSRRRWRGHARDFGLLGRLRLFAKWSWCSWCRHKTRARRIIDRGLVPFGGSHRWRRTTRPLQSACDEYRADGNDDEGADEFGCGRHEEGPYDRGQCAGRGRGTTARRHADQQREGSGPACTSTFECSIQLFAEIRESQGEAFLDRLDRNGEPLRDLTGWQAIEEAEHDRRGIKLRNPAERVDNLPPRLLPFDDLL